MPYSIEYDPQTDIIFIKVEGRLTLETIRELVSEVVLLAKEKGCLRILSDLHEAVPALSVLDVYNIPGLVKELASASGLPGHKFRRAVILPDRWGLSQFFETVSKNRVQNVTVFQDMETARQWLLGN